MGLLPVYYQIKQYIRALIRERPYNPGEKIPSENELAKRFKVNRLTVRQAISQLVEEGLLQRKQGLGTFVKADDQVIRKSSLEFIGFMDDLFYEVSKVKTNWTSLRKIAASSIVREKLGAPYAREVVCIKRVRLLRNELFAYTVNYLPLELGKRIKKGDLLKKPLLQILEQDLGVEFMEAFQTIEASFANQEVSEKLQVPQGTPVLYLERIMYDKNKKAVELVQSSHLGEKYKYIMRLTSVRKGKNRWAAHF